MDELMKINAKIRKKQIGKLIGVVICGFCSAGLLASYSYQKGITKCQKTIAKFYPAEYASMTAKVLEVFEKERVT